MQTRRNIPLGLALLALLIGVWWLVPRLLHPWANPFSAGGTLLGEWAGTAATPTGRPLRLWLSMALHDPNRICGRARCGTYAEGRAITCDERGTLRSYRITATVPDNDESRIRVSITAPPETASELRLADLRASRTGDTLRLETRLHAPGPVTTTLWTDENGVDRSSIKAGHPDAEATTAWTLARSAGPLPRNCPPA